jgi:hypothetical protein
LLAHAVESSSLQFAQPGRGFPAVAKVKLQVIPLSGRRVQFDKDTPLASELSDSPDELFPVTIEYRT